MTPFLAIAAIVRDEIDYIDEWIAFHEVVGVEHFYIYDNGSIDGTCELLRERPNITVIDWPGERQQLAAYANALVRCNAHWLAFIDIDEFLFSPTYQPVSTILRRYEDVDAVGACWAVYGTSGWEQRPNGGVIANYLLRSDQHNPVNLHVKSIVRPARVRSPTMRNPHEFDCDGVDTLGRPLVGPFAQSVTWKWLRINHYWSKSVAEAQVKAKRPRADNGELRSGLTSGHLNLRNDSTIIPYVRLVEARLWL